MSKTALLAMAILGMVSAPATAGMVGTLETPQTHPGLQQINPGHGTIGVLNTLGTIVSSNALIYPNASDVITVTFGIHQPYVTPILVERNRNGLSWDPTEVVLIGAGPAGPFVTNNIGNTPAAGAARLNSIASTSPGAACGLSPLIAGIEQFPASPFVFNGSSTTPFFRVTFHAQGPFGADSLLDLFAPGWDAFSQHLSMTPCGGPATTAISMGVGLIFRTFTTTMAHTASSSSPTNIIPGTGLFITAGAASTPSFGVELRPEPASATLLGIGALALTAGFRRRQRHAFAKGSAGYQTP